jgi:hypothetical protein
MKMTYRSDNQVVITIPVVVVVGFDAAPGTKKRQPMNEIQLTPDSTLVISRQNAAAFHQQVKERIKETGEGLFEYLEVIKFFEKLKEVISGDTASKIPADSEFRDMARTEIVKYGKEGFTTKRGAKFTLAEVGTKYDFSQTNDPVLAELIMELNEILVAKKSREDFLKTIPKEGLDIVTKEGEVIRIFPPTKTSVSSYKITLPR